MAVLADYHMHSTFSGDAESPMEDMVKAAIDKGLSEICFTEHNDILFPYSESDKKGMYEVNTDSYLYELLCMREKYGDRIKIGFGVELGMQDIALSLNEKYAKSFDFDFIIFSCHIVNGKDPYYPPYYEGRSEEEALREYFECILESIKKFNDYNVVGHLDYIVRYAPDTDKNYCYDKYKDILDKILKTLIESGRGIEINTAGLKRYKLKDVHPCTEVVRKYREMGGEIITVGSDAHNTGDIAIDFDRAQEVLKASGFKYYTTFEKRKPSFIRL